MGIGLGVVLLLLGLILALDVVVLPDAVEEYVASDTLGWILIVLGVLSIILVLIMNAQRQRHTTRVEDDRPPPPATY